jgi:hypothetical protein
MQEVKHKKVVLKDEEVILAPRMAIEMAEINQI